MDAFVRVVALAMILLAPLAAADREEVPVVREFHEAMTNRDHGQSFAEFHIFVQVLIFLGAIHKGRPQDFRDFGPPPPLVRIFARSKRVNPHNLPYYVCFWATPLPPSRCGRPLCMAP